MKIVINPFSSKSVNNAIRALEKYRKDLDKRVERLVERLVVIAENAARQKYGGNGNSVTLTHEKTADGQYTIYAKGAAVCFIEFGAGVRTKVTQEIYEDIPFSVTPGSWSNENRDKDDPLRYDTWVASGKSAEDWPYNRYPRAGMVDAYNAIVNNIAAEAKKVFAE